MILSTSLIIISSSISFISLGICLNINNIRRRLEIVRMKRKIKRLIKEMEDKEFYDIICATDMGLYQPGGKKYIQEGAKNEMPYYPSPTREGRPGEFDQPLLYQIN